MRIRSLYLSIYLTVIAVLLVFALVAGLLVRHHAQAERGQFEAAMAERTAAWASLIEKSQPPASADTSAQAEALQDASQRLGVALALESAEGRRIATTRLFEWFEAHPGERRVPATRVRFADGRGLLVMPSRPPWEHGPRFQPPERPEIAPPAGRPDEMFRPGLPGHDREPRGPKAGGPDGAWPKLPHGPWGRSWWDEGVGVLTLLAVLFGAIAAGSYPVVRRLTRRLETLQQGVEAFGAGELSYRVPASGGDEVALVAHSFNRAAQRIEDLVRANRSLLANASHELRSPLARLKMAVAMMETAPDAARPALKQEIDHDIRELDALVEEVLLASRLDAQEASMAQDPVDLSAVVAEEAARLGVPMEMDPLALQAQLRGDERLLRRAVRNLLENARRYGGGEVLAEVRFDPAERCLQVWVCDRGPGVPESERERIFQPFFRLPGHSEKAGGVGLGLSLVRQIANQHAGQVRCESREGGGSCFVLSVPALP